MKSVERAEDTLLSQMETGDQEGTSEQRRRDLGNQTVYIGAQSKAKSIIQKKTKKKQSENIIFTD